MTRAVPRLVAAYLAVGKKVYATRRQAYYAIAKSLVVAKYPAWLTADGIPDAVWYGECEKPPWPQGRVLARRHKAYRLFHATDNFGGPIDFDDRRWVSFVRRVARYLEWVDDRRSFESRLAHIPTDDLESREQYCERLATEFADASIHYRNELARRTAQ